MLSDSKMANEVALIYAVFPTAGEGHDACRKLLNERLIACANRLPLVISHFRWEGEIEAKEEHPVIFKTSPGKARAAMERIAALHRYQVPAVIELSVAPALPAFAQWVDTETS
jgi:periplasmic divalent cation tolerance protein